MTQNETKRVARFGRCVVGGLLAFAFGAVFALLGCPILAGVFTLAGAADLGRAIANLPD